MSPIQGQPSKRAYMTGGLTVQDLVVLAEKAPDVYRDLLAREPSWRRLAWIELIAHIIGHLTGLAALLILAAVSWHAIDRGAAAEGASIICTGAVSIVAVFVTGRLARMPSARQGRPQICLSHPACWYRQSRKTRSAEQGVLHQNSPRRM